MNDHWIEIDILFDDLSSNSKSLFFINSKFKSQELNKKPAKKTLIKNTFILGSICKGSYNASLRSKNIFCSIDRG